MFEIIETKALIKSINPRAENHGDETALACDIALEFSVSNQMLERLDVGLLGCLYQRHPTGAGSADQDHLDLEDNFLPHLRFPLLGKLSWEYEGVGYTFQLITDELHGNRIISVSDCKVNKFDIECEEGGTISLSVRVQGHPSEETIGELCHFIKSDELVSLLAPRRDVDTGDFDEL